MGQLSAAAMVGLYQKYEGSKNKIVDEKLEEIQRLTTLAKNIEQFTQKLNRGLAEKKQEISFDTEEERRLVDQIRQETGLLDHGVYHFSQSQAEYVQKQMTSHITGPIQQELNHAYASLNNEQLELMEVLQIARYGIKTCDEEIRHINSNMRK